MFFFKGKGVPSVSNASFHKGVFCRLFSSKSDLQFLSDSGSSSISFVFDATPIVISKARFRRVPANNKTISPSQQKKKERIKQIILTRRRPIFRDPPWLGITIDLLAPYEKIIFLPVPTIVCRKSQYKLILFFIVGKEGIYLCPSHVLSDNKSRADP